jgi:hypothetical protein
MENKGVHDQEKNEMIFALLEKELQLLREELGEKRHYS